MSIRKRLLLSNIAMVVIPVIVYILVISILLFLFLGDIRDVREKISGEDYSEEIEQIYTELKKAASLSKEQLLDQQYLESMEAKLVVYHSALAVRKGRDIYFISSELEEIEANDLPSFGQEFAGPPFRAIRGNSVSIKQYDFYFSDGSEGSLFLMEDSEAFVNFMKKLIPLLFGSFFLILIATNGFLTYFVSKSIIKPVKSLTKAAQQISEGKLNFQIESKKNDEIGLLSRTFEMMRGKLQESIEIQKLYEKNRKELIANISHDLKTPITSIKGYVEGIRDGIANSPEKMDEYVETIYSKSKDMDRLIDELFLYSKLDLNREPFYFEEIDLKNYFLDFIEELRFDYEKEGAHFSIEIEEKGSYIVCADRDKLRRVVTNIVGNSLKYIDKDHKRIQFFMKTVDDEVTIQIQDNGPGISEEALHFIFDRFYRVDPSRTSLTGGSGLGLAIVKRIIDEHGGKVWAESQLGEGTSIFFTLGCVKC